MSARPKFKNCAVCGGPFTPARTTQRVCSVPCAQTWAEQRSQEKAEKEARKVHRAQKEKLKSRSDRIHEAQAAFNAYIRERDRDEPCISCQRTEAEIQHDNRGGLWDAGHYRSRGACPELRFHPMNAAKQCKQCNRDKSGHVVEFRIHLQARIGADNLAWIEGPHQAQKLTVEDLIDVKLYYRFLLKQMKIERGTTP